MCDFAQYYRVLDWRSLPLPLAATLAAGLPRESRCRSRSEGREWPTETLLLAVLCDYVGLALWRLAGGPESDREPPEGMLSALLGREPKKQETAVQSFESGEAFLRAWEGR